MPLRLYTETFREKTTNSLYVCQISNFQRNFKFSLFSTINKTTSSGTDQTFNAAIRLLIGSKETPHIKKLYDAFNNKFHFRFHFSSLMVLKKCIYFV